MDPELESLLLALEKAANELEDAVARRNIWLKRCMKAGATSRQMAEYSGLSHVSALKLAQQRPTRAVVVPEVGRDGIVRERD